MVRIHTESPNVKNMAKEYTQIELNANDIKKIVAEKYDLDINKTTVSINHTKGEYPYGVDYTSIIVKGEKNEKS